MKLLLSGSLLLLACLVLSLAPARFAAAASYDEATDGDLSGDGLQPTSLNVAPGSNPLVGTTGRATATDRDYATFVVPSGYQWSALVMLPGTVAGGALSFLGLQAGPQVTVPPSASDATGLLGFTHYDSGAIGLDLLPLMGVPNLGSTGFSAPLPAGAYSLWIQDFNSGSFAYGFDIQITPVPEPGVFALALVLLLLVFWTRSAGSRRILPR